MFKLVVSFALLALCHASLYQGEGYGHDVGHGYDHGYYVEVGDNHIVVSNQAGQRLYIHTDHKHIGGTGHFVQIHVSGPGVILKSEQYMHRPVTFEGPFQTDILYHIFNKFSGPLDEVTYDKLVHVIHEHVQDGSVHPAVLYALRILSHHHQSMELVNPEHQEVYKAVQKLFDHSGVEKNVLYSRYNQAGSWYGHHGVEDYDKLHSVGGSHDFSHQSYHPGVYGSHDWSHQSYQPGVYGSHDWSHQSYQPGVYGSHDWSRQSYQPGVYGSHQSYYPGLWSRQSYGSQYPWGKQSYESHYPYSASHSYGSHYPLGSGVQGWAHSSVYPRDWSHLSYGSQYPVHGQSWGEHSYSGPYSGSHYDNAYGHGVGAQHWGQTGLWSPWHGVNAVQQPHVVV